MVPCAAYHPVFRACTVQSWTFYESFHAAIGQFAIKKRRSLAKKTIYHLCDHPTGLCRGIETRLQPDGRSMK